MPKYTVYLNRDLDEEIRSVASKQGQHLTEVLRRRIQSHASQDKLDVLGEKIDAVFSLLELVIGDLGYIAGATRAGTKNVDSALKEGGFYENRFKSVASTLKRVFERTQSKERNH